MLDRIGFVNGIQPVKDWLLHAPTVSDRRVDLESACVVNAPLRTKLAALCYWQYIKNQVVEMQLPGSSISLNLNQQCASSQKAIIVHLATVTAVARHCFTRCFQRGSRG